MIDVDGMKWLLGRIQSLEEMNSRSRWPTQQNIYAGSHDVWMCEQDRIDSIEIPKQQMKAAQEYGYIKSEIRSKGKFDLIVWSLTATGKYFLNGRI